MNLHDLLSSGVTLIPFKAGQTIFKQGDKGDVMFILFEGIVDVVVGEKSIGSFEPVEIFGEMTVIEPGVRSASIVAQTDCTFASFNQKRFLILVQSKPEFALHIMRMLVERMRWMDESSKSNSAADKQEIAKLQEQLKALTTTTPPQSEPLEKAAEAVPAASAKTP